MIQDPANDPEQRARGREHHEPEELRNPIPWPVGLVALALIAWGAGYYYRDIGAPVDAGDRRSAIVVDPNAKVDGEAVFAGNCAACHQANGQGLPGVFPPLAGSEWVTGPSATVMQIVLHGLSGPIEVRGQRYEGVMPAFAQLTDAELAAVISHVRSSWGNDAGAVTADEVGAARKLERSASWTAAELRAAGWAP